jgi:hypothetical protein
MLAGSGGMDSFVHMKAVIFRIETFRRRGVEGGGQEREEEERKEGEKRVLCT